MDMQTAMRILGSNVMDDTGRITNVCAICGNRFVFHYPQEKTCSPDCKKQYEKRKLAERQKNFYTRHPEKKRYASHGNTVRIIDRKFVAWDGEGEDGKYTLLAASDGRLPLVNRERGLSTEECFHYLLSAERQDVVNVWYSFGYDVSMMLKDIPLFGRRSSLEQLHKQGYTRWNGYHIRYIPRKILQISDGRKNTKPGMAGGTYTAYDTFSFFQSSFEKAVEDWLGGVPELLSVGKAAREEFNTWAMDRIAAYNQMELDLLIQMLEKLRGYLKEAGLDLRGWWGPGAIAYSWLEANNAKQYIAPVPKDMQHAVMSAYFGGRVESAAWGYAAPIYHYDINSAYPAAFRYLPDLSMLDWKLVPADSGTPHDHCLCHVKWDCDYMVSEELDKKPAWGPFPFRMKNGSIFCPTRGEGWYWGVEALAAMRRCKGIEVIEYWQPEGVLRFPFKSAIEKITTLRLQWKAEKNAAHLAIKLMINSLYGKTAQKKGHGAVRDEEDRAPRFQCYPWAGFITAYCRAAISDAILAADGEIISVMTDSVYALKPLDDKLAVGPLLGEWSPDPEVHAGLFCGAGLGELYDSAGKPVKGGYKSRGFAGSSPIDFRQLVGWWEEYRKTRKVPEDYNPVIAVRRFVGIGTALAVEGMSKYYGKFVTTYKEISLLPFIGDSKRSTVAGFWSLDRGADLHFMLPLEPIDPDTREPISQRDHPDYGRELVSSAYKAGQIEAELRPEFKLDFAAFEDEDA